MTTNKLQAVITFFFRLIAASSSSIGKDVDTFMRFGRILAHIRLSAAVAAVDVCTWSSCVQSAFIVTYQQT